MHLQPGRDCSADRGAGDAGTTVSMRSESIMAERTALRFRDLCEQLFRGSTCWSRKVTIPTRIAGYRHDEDEAVEAAVMRKNEGGECRRAAYDADPARAIITLRQFSAGRRDR